MSRRNDDNSEEVEEWSSEEEEKEWSSASYKYASSEDIHNHNQSDNDNENENDSDSDDHGDDSSIDDESIYESSSSSDNHEEEEEEHAPGFTSTFLRRRRPQEDKGSQIVVTTTTTTTTPREGPNSPFPTNSPFLPEKSRKPRNRQRRRRRTHCCALYQERCPGLFCNGGRCSSCFLIVALLLWIHVQAFSFYYYYFPGNANANTNVWQISPEQGGYAQSVQERIAKARNPSSSSSSFWGAAVSNKLFHHRKKRGTSVEDIPSDCVLQDWQRQTFPNCNMLHEIDLAKHLQVPSRYRRDPDRNYTATDTKGRYISSGLWRDVWSVAPTVDTYPHELVVLKMIKPEHEVNARNIERHRRDALVMEHLTSSENVVDLYSYCGNSVVTEHAPRGLDKFLQEATFSKTTSFTPLQRLQLALQTSKGIAALHYQKSSDGNVDGNVNVIHADIQSKQFLVVAVKDDDNGDGDNDSQERGGFVVKVNDFNRCRFLPRHNGTGEVCPIRIPSAPGLSRAPEEYALDPLTEALDVYSLGNVLYEILMGKKPYDDWGSNRVKAAIRKGMKPEIPEEYRQDPSDAALAVLIHLCLEHDVSTRISAPDLVQELERLVQNAVQPHRKK